MVPRPARVVASVKPSVKPAPPVDAAAMAAAKNAYQEGLRKLMQGSSGEAARLFEQALQKNPRLILAYRGLGLAYEKQGRKSMARAAFTRYLKLHPKAGDADAIRRHIAQLK